MLSDVGRLRAANEDTCLEAPEEGLWAVADGMGGHGFGDVASAWVVELLARFSPPAGPHLEDSVEQLQGLLVEANTGLRDEALRRDRRVIGSTVVVLLIPSDKSEGEAAVLWAGDSRAYRYRSGAVTCLTRDHTYVEEMVSLGVLTPEQAIGHPQGHIVTRAVGAGDVLEVDWVRVDVQPGDRFLLCSDGLTGELNDDEIAAAMQQPDCTVVARVLVQGALDHGGRDNISVVVVDVELPLG
jgi:protein phosphatase